MIHTKLPITESPTPDVPEQKPTERFFEDVLKKVEETAIRTGTRKESKELIRIIMDMQYQASRTEIIL
jgi:sulfopyruvate decarboxylase TPP-binding subunit